MPFIPLLHPATSKYPIIAKSLGLHIQTLNVPRHLNILFIGRLHMHIDLQYKVLHEQGGFYLHNKCFK